MSSLNSQESGALPPCSPFGFSSNYLPGENGEVLNRLLYLNTDNLKFDPKKYKYFGKGVKELSCVLPYFLEIGSDKITEMHDNIKDDLLKKYPTGSNRMLSQIAIAITGLYAFQQIAGNKVLNIPYKDKLPEYINNCITRFESAKNPIEKLLDAFPALIWKHRIVENKQFEIKQFNNITTLRFHKTAICLEYNSYIAEEASERINSRKIKNEDGENYKILIFNKSEKINGVNQHIIELDISNYPTTQLIIDACRGYSGL